MSVEPTVLIQPENIIVLLGETIRFTTVISGGTPPYYIRYWVVNDTPQPYERETTFDFTPLETGFYEVRIILVDSDGYPALGDDSGMCSRITRTYTLPNSYNIRSNLSPHLWLTVF